MPGKQAQRDWGAALLARQTPVQGPGPPGQRPFLGLQAGVGVPLSVVSPLPPVAPTSSGAAKAFVGEPWGREAPCQLIHRAGGSAMPAPGSRWALLPGGASGPPPTAAACSPALSFPGALELWPRSQLKDDGEPLPPGPHTSPFTRWHQTRGNAGWQLGTGAQLCPPPAQPTSGRREEHAAPKKPLQDGALEILSTNYESGDKRGICKSISDKTFPGQSFPRLSLDRATCWLMPFLPLPLSHSRLRDGGLSGREGPRARLYSVEVSLRSPSGCHQEGDRPWGPWPQFHLQQDTRAKEAAGLPGAAQVGRRKSGSHCERARERRFPGNAETRARGGHGRQAVQAPPPTPRRRHPAGGRQLLPGELQVDSAI